MSRLKHSAGKGPLKLLVLDTNYTLEGIRERQIEDSIMCRDLGGFFDHVWSVHPFATLVTSDRWGRRNGSPQRYELAPRHTIIEGRVGRFDWPDWAFPANFLTSQVGLFRYLRRLIRTEGIQVIRAASPLYVGLFGWLLARSTGAKLAIRVGANHDKFFETTGKPMEPRLMRSRRIEKAVERFVFRRADLVVSANQDNLDFALAAGARPGRSTIFRYGNLVDRRHHEEPERRRYDPRTFDDLGVGRGRYLLYVGRLEPIKQPDHVLQVLKHVRDRGFDADAVLAGEGTMREDLERITQKLGIAAHVRFAGNVDQGRLAQLYPNAAAVVSPHTGRALGEAAFGAAPVAAYDVDWQGEIVEDRVTGRLVPHNDLGALAHATADLLTDPNKAKQMGERLRGRAVDLLDPAKLDDHERETYRRLLAGEKIGAMT